MEILQKEICLRSNLLILNIIVQHIEADTRTFENQVVVVEVAVVILAFDNFEVFILGKVIGFQVLVAVSDHQFHFREVPADKTVGGDSFLTES